jgi:signal transduction histidine kinase
MGLVQKLSLAFLLGAVTILAANGYRRVRHEVAVFDADRERDHDLIGRTLGAAVVAVWRSEGEQQAKDLIAAANRGEARVRIRWVWLDGASAAQNLHVDPRVLSELAPGATVTRIAPDERGENERYTYAALRVANRVGGLELSESLDAERSFMRRTILDSAGTTVLLALVMMLLSYVLGSFFVGKPVRALVNKARSVGRGDFGNPVHLRSRDELAELAGEMNAMSDALVAANARIGLETEARLAALEQLRHADRLNTVGKLASGVAHELGTPLNVVAARADMIRTGDATPDESREYARIICDSTRKMTRIIRQLLEFARRQGPRKERRDVVGVAEHSLELLRPLAERQHVSLSLDASGRHEANIDAAQIEQVLTNLVVNAVQAMPSGGEVEVSVREERARPPAEHGGDDAQWVTICVRDHGDGIAPHDLTHIFEPFFTTKDIGQGTGLGLSVAYGIVRDHGGWIDVESTPGKGSVFALFLPTEAS